MPLTTLHKQGIDGAFNSYYDPIIEEATTYDEAIAAFGNIIKSETPSNKAALEFFTTLNEQNIVNKLKLDTRNDPGANPPTKDEVVDYVKQQLTEQIHLLQNECRSLQRIAPIATAAELLALRKRLEEELCPMTELLPIISLPLIATKLSTANNI